MKKIIIIIFGLIVLLITIAIFKPIIPLSLKSITGNSLYFATRSNIYYITPEQISLSGNIHQENILITGANLWNSKILGKTLITPNAVYTEWGSQLTGADPITYTQIDFLIYNTDGGSVTIPEFGYDKDNLYIDGKVIILSGDKQPFTAYKTHIKSQ